MLETLVRTFADEASLSQVYRLVVLVDPISAERGHRAVVARLVELMRQLLSTASKDQNRFVDAVDAFMTPVLAVASV